MAPGRQLPRQVRVAERRSGRRRAAGVSQRTTEFYEEAIRRHLVKGLGRVPLCKLTPEDVDGYLQEEAAARALGTLGNRVEARLKAPLIAPKHRLLRL